MLILNKPISAIVTYLDPGNTARQLANAHTLFNLTNVIILLPFSKYIVRLSTKIMPLRDNEDEISSNTKYLDDRMFETPSIALANSVQEVIRMGNKSTNTLKYSMSALIDKDSAVLKKAFESEKTVNKLQKDLLTYLLKLSKEPLRDDERFMIDSLYHTVNDIERVSDHAENIAELAGEMIKSDLVFSETAIQEINEIYGKTLQNLEFSMTALNDMDFNLANEVLKTEEEVNYLEKTYRKAHITRLNEGDCTIDAGVIFLDLLTNIERISDHCKNIARMVLDFQ